MRFLRGTRVATWTSVVVLGIVARRNVALARAAIVVFIATVGIAHGATDDALLARAGVRPRGGRTTISALYGTAAVATFALARRMPGTASRALAALSCYHFGAGDAAFARACGSHDMGVWDTVVRGALPLGIAGRDGRSRAIAALAYLTVARYVAEGRLADALDLALPTALLSATQPRLGFAIYFGAWHAVRHTALILDRDVRGGTPSARYGRFVRESAPNVAIALGVAALAVAWERRAPRVTRDDAATEALAGALVLAITVPHEIAVGMLERRSRAS
ncbi:MAG: hypothetical protein NVSMB59_18890 [Vulcanimicrobiaceae bacterium]